ncbi:MBL fold metallo-hydrolase [Paenibacillus bovis]|uniref:MBL fold metallo-hydrolase n=1 Tax=Paenibacillus bovis TaxID=1616788 RepID=A0A172ZDA3_9BACL|nr:MBL fold metallo-hydrolase [Paenibacillus bovis]ANF95509.1 MBL fold metallo-hydrolase [Paenibacillus bovis]
MLTSTPVSLWLGAAGYCTHPEVLTIRGGTLRPVAFPAGFACIRHPKHGIILFDTGYSSRFFTETATLPQAAYRYITPVVYEEQDSAADQLGRMEIDAADVQYVILSHFHGDHIAAVQDFPNSRFIYLAESYEAVRKLGTLRAVKAGFLSGLLPEDWIERSLPFYRKDLIHPSTSGQLRAVERKLSVSSKSSASGEWSVSREAYGPQHDLFGDGSLFAIELSGHAEGMIGLLLSTSSHDYLLCADTVWSSRALRENRRPHPLAGIIMSDRREYVRSMDRLREWSSTNPELRIVPSHCREVLAEWGGRWLT